jgi:hypothetical protein
MVIVSPIMLQCMSRLLARFCCADRPPSCPLSGEVGEAVYDTSGPKSDASSLTPIVLTGLSTRRNTASRRFLAARLAVDAKLDVHYIFVVVKFIRIHGGSDYYGSNRAERTESDR